MKPVLRPVAVLGVALAGAGLALSGAVLPVRQPRPIPPVEAQGRTVSVCPPAGTVNAISATTWGELEIRPLTAATGLAVPPGRGRTIPSGEQPVLMLAEGRQNQASAASAYDNLANGRDRGLSLARCSVPTTTAWFTGLAADPGQAGLTVRSEVVLVNPDEGQAEVDLRFFGPNGVQTASGGRGITVPGRSTRVIALESLFTQPERVGMEVRTARGRIWSAVRQHASLGVQPAGSDWQVASAHPAPVQVVPGVPDGPGSRELVLTNPGARRTTAKVEVIGPDGTFAPADAASVDVNAESTVRVPITTGLNGDVGAVRITADQPLVAAVSSRSSDVSAESDLAVQPAAAELTGTSLAAVAVDRGVTGAVVVSNTGTRDANVPMKVVDATGRELMSVELPVAAGRSNLWEIKQVDVPAAVQIRTPRDAQLYAGVVLTSGSGPVAGLASAPFSVPEQTTAGVDPVHDPGVGR
ncbi:hypothetical protein CGZ93_11370 [Enemella dayhoffiae]|uniref:Secreted protein n=1 Tax=Enemella dayhoffiae TaxID=2016507 RepID=A0A255H0W0_9ACTN|nr:DUF5719 family protein [Enemella dayhoffiae]OYO20823.1 hypothetical protein CGZ93_11370 [Enemella dayhoffiae]